MNLETFGAALIFGWLSGAITRPVKDYFAKTGGAK